jgi:hypothetical protein
MNQASDAANTSGAKREIVLVSGMHRSGTSALTRVFNLAGGVLPHPLVEPAVGNELGHWEPAEVVAMNDRALLSAGGDVNSVFPVASAWLRSQAAHAFTAEVEAYIARLGDAPQTWFIKDPRISLLAGLWSEGVQRTGASPRFVIAFRNPWEVAASLTKRQLHHFPDEVWPVERGLSLWLNYMLTIERKTRGLPRSFVSYEAFLGDWSGELGRIHQQLGLAEPQIDDHAKREIEAFVRPDQRHARHEAMTIDGGLANRVYAMLLERVGDPDGGRAALDEAGRSFTASFDVLGGYLSALEARAAQFGPLRAEASRAETEALASKQATQALEMRIMHLARTRSAPLVAGADGAAASSGDSLLQRKHEALKAAHRRNIEAIQAERLCYEETLARLSREFENELQAKEDRLTELNRYALVERLAASAYSERLTTPETAARRQGELDVVEAREAYEAWSLESADLRATGRRGAGLERMLAEAAAVSELPPRSREPDDYDELRDSREAYEALRLEAAELYARLRAADAVLADARRAIADANAAQAELALVQRSRSWRITSPLRSAAALFGRA